MTQFNRFLLCLVLAGVALPCLTAGCSARPARRGVLLVTVEGNVAKPEVKGREFSKRAVLPVSPETLPSAASALTGLFPPQHGLRVDGVGALDPSVPTVASRFRERGFECAAFSSTLALAQQHALTNGFSSYEAAFSPTNAAAAFTVPADVVVDRALEWLASAPKDRDVFVWVHITPFAGVERTEAVDTYDLASLADAKAAAAAQISRLVSAFSSDSPVLVLPLFGLGADRDFRGLSLDDPAFATAEAYCSALPRQPLGVADVPFALGAADAAPACRYLESVVPWYAFRLPPLQRVEGDAEPGLSVLSGITDVKPAPQAWQGVEAAALRASGHLGEGLVPPCTGIAPRASISTNDAARIVRYRAARAASGADRIALLRALVADFPDVPLFHEELGEELLKVSDLGEASNRLAAAADLGYNMVRANRLCAISHLRIGNTAAAISCAESAFIVNETDPLVRHELVVLLLNTGKALLEAGDMTGTRDCVNRALFLEPWNKDAQALSAAMGKKLSEK